MPIEKFERFLWILHYPLYQCASSLSSHVKGKISKLLDSGLLNTFRNLPDPDKEYTIERFKELSLIFSDLDGTLVESKNPLADHDIEILEKLLQTKKLVIITGWKIETVQKNLISKLQWTWVDFKNLILLPLLGLEQWHFDIQEQKYILKNEIREYAFPDVFLDMIEWTIEDVIRNHPLMKDTEIIGNMIERRGTNACYNLSVSCLWQDAPSDKEKAKIFEKSKKSFDPHGNVRKQLITAILSKLPEEIHQQITIAQWWSTSLDITYGWATKATGIRTYKKNDFPFEFIEFGIMGDRFDPLGNDFSMYATHGIPFWTGDKDETFSFLKRVVAD